MLKRAPGDKKLTDMDEKQRYRVEYHKYFDGLEKMNQYQSSLASKNALEHKILQTGYDQLQKNSG
jgi:hypothetical protein